MKLRSSNLISRGIFVLVTAMAVAACSSTSNSIINISISDSNAVDTTDSPPDNGWVELSFDITETGKTDNIKVLASYPSDYFEEEAIRALSKWTYKPKMENGIPVRQVDNLVHLDFSLEGEENQ